MSAAFDINAFDSSAFDTEDVAPAGGAYGGIGHYLEAIEQARQLAKITRNTPSPIDRTSRPQFAPVGRPPIAPVVDLQAIQNQRTAAQLAASARAATIKRGRQEAEILLLAC